jgi:hypothetical protein
MRAYAPSGPRRVRDAPESALMPEPVPIHRPLVSVVIIGRNDNFRGDALYRLSTSLSFLAQSAAHAGILDEVEIIVVDWISERPLSSEVALAPEARRATAFLAVTPEMIRSHGYGRGWHATLARECRGEARER